MVNDNDYCLLHVADIQKVVRPSGYLNQSLPVLVWIYGGGFYWGSSADPRYNLSGIVKTASDARQPFIGVSINYRLGVWGFLQTRKPSPKDPRMPACSTKEWRCNGSKRTLPPLAVIPLALHFWAKVPALKALLYTCTPWTDETMICTMPRFWRVAAQSGRSSNHSRSTTWPSRTSRVQWDAGQLPTNSPAFVR